MALCTAHICDWSPKYNEALSVKKLRIIGLSYGFFATFAKIRSLLSFPHFRVCSRRVLDSLTTVLTCKPRRRNGVDLAVRFEFLYFCELTNPSLSASQRDFEGIARHFERSPHVRLILKYDEALSHMIYSASDMFVIPSIFEPCGLTQVRQLPKFCVKKTAKLRQLEQYVYAREVNGTR